MFKLGRLSCNTPSLKLALILLSVTRRLPLWLFVVNNILPQRATEVTEAAF